MRIESFSVAVVVGVALSGCSKPDPLYCDSNTPCDDPERPYCDLEGEFPASEGLGRTCIAQPDFAFSLARDDAQVRIGGELALDVTVDRIDRFPSDIVVEATGLPAGASAEPLTIPGDATTGTLVIAGGDADPGAVADITVTATASPAAGPLAHDAPLHLLVLGPAGSLDPTFGTLGLAAEPPSTTDDATGLAQLADGSLIVGGATFNGDVGALVHFSSEGVLDSSFGIDGVLRFDLTESGFDPVAPYRFAQQADGKVVMAVGSSTGDVLLARFTEVGDFDPTFAGGGLATVPITSVSVVVYGVATGPSDEIVVAMVTGSSREQIQLVRFTRDGVRDESFAGGRLVFDRGTNHLIGNLHILIGGAVLLAGSAQDDASTIIPFLCRFTPQGALDVSFGTGGVVELGQGTSVRASLELENGDLVVAGSIATTSTPPNLPALWRLTPAGAMDSAFASEGELRVSNVNGGVSDLLATSDGLIAISSPDITLIRVDPATGVLDPGFGDGGITALPLAEGFATLAVRRTDGRFVVLADDDSFQFVLARFFE
jgi:uncharacterized delta-60 repeat protein